MSILQSSDRTAGSALLQALDSQRLSVRWIVPNKLEQLCDVIAGVELVVELGV